MIGTQGFLSEKNLSPERASALLSVEVKTHLFVFALLSVATEVYLLSLTGETEFNKESFILATFGFFFLYSVLEYVFGTVVGRVMASLFSVVPALLLVFLVKDMTAAILIAAGLRIAMAFTPKKNMVIPIGSFLLDGLALYLHFARGSFAANTMYEKLMFVALVTLTLSGLQQFFFERNNGAFPFALFALLGLLVVAIPAGEEPIDWTPVMGIGERIADSAREAYSSISYLLSEFSDKSSYVAGYSSFDITGKSVKSSDSVQLILRTDDRPYYTYKDPDTGEYLKIRKTLYLAGGVGVDKRQLVSYINFMARNGVTKEYAGLFSERERLNVEYGYLRTEDIIAPMNSLTLTSRNTLIQEGKSASKHKRGYILDTVYLDMDYGSPYLTDMIRQDSEGGIGAPMSYEDADRYLRSLYNVSLESIVSREQYEEYTKAEDLSPYLASEGASDELKELAEKLTGDVQNTYDKCKVIEGYLRQYSYNSTVQNRTDKNYNMATLEGMENLADLFLFETGKGYCVHYTSAMVMLLRLSGIPAKPVMGYRYLFPFEAEDNYKVSGDCAHIWPEAYIENVGWVPFEPTSGYLNAQDVTWHRKPVEDVAVERTPEVYIPTIYNEEVNMMLEREEEIEAEKEETIGTELLRIGIPFAIFILLLLLVLILGKDMVRRIRYANGNLEQKLLLDVEMIQREISKRHKEEFLDRGLVSDYIKLAPSELAGETKAVFDSYYRMLYGGKNSKAVTKEESLRAFNLRKEYHRYYSQKDRVTFGNFRERVIGG